MNSLLSAGARVTMLAAGVALLALADPLPGAAQASPVVVYESPYDYETTRENLELALLDQGLSVSGTLHVSDMLARTGKDLGFPEQVYVKAESLEFCSALMSQRMTALDPANLVICPFTIALYVRADEPKQVYVAFRRQFMLDPDGEVARAVFDLLDTIVREAIS